MRGKTKKSTTEGIQSLGLKWVPGVCHAVQFQQPLIFYHITGAFLSAFPFECHVHNLCLIGNNNKVRINPSQSFIVWNRIQGSRRFIGRGGLPNCQPHIVIGTNSPERGDWYDKRGLRAASHIGHN